MYTVLPRGLALGALLALLLSLFDGGTAIPSPGPSFNNGCAVYDKFGVLHHDCRLARLESSFAPTVMRLQRSLLAATDSQGRHTESRPFGNFTVTLSLARHQLPASSNDLVHTLQKFAVVHASDAEPQGKGVCIPHVQSHAQDAFRNPDGQLRSEVCKERLICCDEAPDGVSKFMSDRPASCSAMCLLRMNIKNNRRGSEQADCQSESRPRPRMPLAEGFDSAAVWDEPTGASCWSQEGIDSGDEFCSELDGQRSDDCNDIPAKGIDPFPSVTEPSFLDVVGRFSRKMGSKMAVESNYQDKHGRVTHVHGHSASRHGHHPSRTNSEDSSTQNGEDDDGDTSADDNDTAVNDGASSDEESPPEDSPPEAEDPIVEDPAEAPAPMTSASSPPSTSDSSPKNVQSGSGSGSGAAAAAAAAGGAAAASSSGSGAGAAAATASS